MLCGLDVCVLIYLVVMMLGFGVGLLECCLRVVIAGWFSCRLSVGWLVC